jgi:hypothetical protein
MRLYQRTFSEFIMKPKNLTKTILELSKILKDTQYAIRGTASLVLQNYDMNVDDIDIICDEETSLKCNELLKEYLVEKVEYSESEKFKSYFGKFSINNILVEIMGEWEIKNLKSQSSNLKTEWVGPFDASDDEITQVKIENQQVHVTTVETELKMFAAMGRWNAFQKIKKQVESKNSPQEKLL